MVAHVAGVRGGATLQTPAFTGAPCGLLQLAQQQFLQLVLLLQFTLCELVWITLNQYRPLMLLLQQRIL
ncbi:hypothetical protein HPB47_002199 [Ixodes persulcatus]|uniref:Uncharacterized protein n=1 Tax=Ixodes persulcatus TaxID=34615 RepID=A0AC60PLX1_IXOPE|nr:hypothetical protein HPB47_002199 [Ixodes persulcatus]